ncbi:TRAP transporter substrate-binding protein DctP [Ruegeria marina]|uniref:TRAP-type mannitol/chloroaromatic compound transport system, substrate-binding protein n=1 Tax=Ruegeria marina TaxID=639004 RepID=A0A1G6VM86_9RHOB|nr:TRAP transporter substrate-binding protein DctP [Ruegeria marina]SDD54654.1 TRAP-type mannitol/chloroaromatic compound transport system, substrate-binding protein [Ruegeria marina]
MKHRGGTRRGPADIAPNTTRRKALFAAATVSAGALAAPFVGNAQVSGGRKLTIQSLWTENTIGYRTFKTWCESIVELTEGEIEFVPFAGGTVSEIFDMMTATSAGVLDGMHWVPHYAAITGAMPAGALLTSFPMGLPHPHQWDMLFDSYGGTELARELYARHGLHYVGHVHHDMNLIHSNRPIRSLDDFRGLNLRMPGGIVADCFEAIGARTIALAGSEVQPALASGAIDAADFTGPAMNYDLGFADVSKYIVMGPTSTPCLHQPVDLTIVVFNQDVWNSFTAATQDLLTELVRAFSVKHFTAHQEANIAAWTKFAEAGVEITRLSEDDVERFRKIALPLWFEWANRDTDSARVFKLHLDVMLNPAVAYINPDDIKDFELKL